MTDEKLIEIRGLAMRLLDLTGDQAQAFVQEQSASDCRQQNPPTIGVAPSREAMWVAARRELARRKVRRRFLPEDMFSEGGWNMLLDLYDHEYRDVAVSITSICIGSELPLTTAIRHLELLVAREFAVRIADPDDRRRSFVRLTPKGELAVRAALAAQLESERRCDTRATRHDRPQKALR